MLFRSLTRHAADLVEPAVKVDNLGAASSLVEAVDVLRHEQFHVSEMFEARECMMRRVRPGAPEARPADEAARPVALAHGRLGHEGRELHRGRTFPLALRVAVIRNARLGAAAGTGQDEESGMTGDEVAQRVECHGRTLAQSAALPACSPGRTIGT